MNVGAYSIANTAKLLRQQFDGTIVIVEGGSDARLIKKFINMDRCKIIVALGKANAVGALEILITERVSGILAIVDADFDRIEGSLHDINGLLYYDHHDLEMMLVNSPALDQLLSEYGTDTKISDFESRVGSSIRNAIVTGSRDVGLLRLISIRDSLSLSFEGLAFGPFIDAKSLSINTERLIGTVANHSRLHHLPTESVVHKLKSLKVLDLDPIEVSCGHDAIVILSIGLRGTLGSANHMLGNPETVAKNLRLAYSLTYFQNTRLYESLREWEGMNRPFIVLS